MSPQRVVERHERLWSAARAEEEYSLADASTAQVEKWVWARSNSDRWYLEPFKGARAGYNPGRDLRSPPRRRHRVEELGYDDRGQLVIGRRWLTEIIAERRYVQYGDGMAIARDFATGGVQAITRYELDGTTVVSLAFAMRSPWSYTEEQFHYGRDGRLERVDFDRHNEDTRRLESWRALAVGSQTLSYDGDQLIGVIEHYAGDEQPRTVFPSTDR